MKILRDGDRGHALVPERGRVGVVYQYRAIELQATGEEVKNVLVGVDVETGEVLTIPAQSTPKLKAARSARKEVVMSVRIPRELSDVLDLVAECLHTEADHFTPALIRYYLAAAVSNERLARRLGTLSQSPLATGKLGGNLRIRIRRDLHEAVCHIASTTEGVNMSDLVRGGILAAKQDVLDGHGRGRKETLEALAQAV